MDARPNISALARTTMLVVDDSKPMLEIMRVILLGLGVGRVLLARGVAEALGILQDDVPDLIFVDWCMIPTNGLELVRQLRTARDSPCPFVPIIMCTAYTELRHVIMARDTGVTEFLAKPVSAETVARRIEEVIRRPRDFVRASAFFGPDRRRLAKGLAGHGRRLADAAPDSFEVRFEDG